MRLASRIAINRTVAGVHFPVDSAAGCFLGLLLGQYLWLRCDAPDGGANYDAFLFDGPLYPGQQMDADFYWETIGDALFAGPAVNYIAYIQTPRVFRSGILSWLWDMARDEWI
jgi:hypothetical protein